MSRLSNEDERSWNWQHAFGFQPRLYQQTSNSPSEGNSLVAASMYQDPTATTINNRKHPASNGSRVKVLIGILLGVAFIFVFMLVYFLIGKQETVMKITTTPSSTTRFHRLHVTDLPINQQKSVSEEVVDEEPTYKALIYTDHPECTVVGRSLLLRGGNAQDAAIAALFCLSAAHPHNTGLGGGFYALMGIPGKAVVIDARETSSYQVNLDYYINKTDEMGVGITSVATPSFLPGLQTLYSTTSGKFSLAELAQPTIALCDSGIYVDESLANALQKHRDMIVNDYLARKHFVNSTTHDVYSQGDRMYCSKYSQTLSEILGLEIEHDYFNQSPFAEQIIGEMEETGGYVTRNDIIDYAVRKTLGECISLGEFRICGSGAPSAFGVAAVALQATKETDYPLHVIYPIAYREIKYIGDYDVDASNHTAPELFREDYVKQLVQKMEAGERAVFETYDVPDISTVLVADEFGRAVSVSASLGDTFGSRFYSRFGFFYNNAISSFNRPTSYVFNGNNDPEMINVLQPGKAPRTYISPVIGYHGDKIAFLTSGANIEKQIETIYCMVGEENCYPHESMSPAIRLTDGGYQPLITDHDKMAGY